MYHYVHDGKLSVIIKRVDWRVATLFVQERHYSPVMPRLTKHWLGTYVDDKLVGVLTLGWGTSPKHTIQKLFPELDTKDYYEIGKMCMDESMPRNSESQMLSKTVEWIKHNIPTLKYLFTWADGIVGKPGYVYQAANFLYGGFIWSDVYVTDKGEKIHPRTIQKLQSNSKGLKYGSRPNHDQRVEMNLTRVFGKQFRYIFPMNKSARKKIKTSTEIWSLNYPKDKDLQWKIKTPSSKEWILTDKIPFKHDGTNVEYNSNNVSKVSRKYGTGSLEQFFDNI